MLKTFVYFVQNAVTALKNNLEKSIPSCECSSLLGEKMNKIILYKKNQRQKIHKMCLNNHFLVV